MNVAAWNRSPGKLLLLRAGTGPSKSVHYLWGFGNHVGVRHVEVSVRAVLHWHGYGLDSGQDRHRIRYGT